MTSIDSISDAVQLLDEAQHLQGNIEVQNACNEPSGEETKEEFIEKMQQELGTPCKVSYPPLRYPLRKFHSGRLFSNLTLFADYNSRLEDYNPFEPRLYLSMGEKRVWLPTDSETIRLLGEYFISVSEVLYGMQFPQHDYSVEEVRKILLSFGCVVEDEH